MRPPYGILLADRVTPELGPLLRRARGAGITILLVDDGTEPSGSAAKVASRQGIFSLRHPRRFGRAQALLTGVHYAVEDEVPGAIVVAAADDPAAPEALAALARAATEEDIVVAAPPGPLPGPLAAARGLWAWWYTGRGPAYAVPTRVLRGLSLGPFDRGPELRLLALAARRRLGLKSIAPEAAGDSPGSFRA